MKERPILFSAPMVRALLDGSKTQTRRIVKLPHENQLGEWQPTTIGGEDGGRTAAGATIPAQGAIWHTRTGECLASPYGQPGDRLWVRETWQFYDWTEEGEPCIRFAADNGTTWPEAPRGEGLVDQWEILSRPENYSIDNAARDHRWRPSIHIPRWASRILLEIVSVRVDRLHDLSEADAIAEGIEQMPCDVPDTRLWRNYRPENGWTPRVCIPQNSFRSLWESINGEENCLANSWVWVVEFKRVTP